MGVESFPLASGFLTFLFLSLLSSILAMLSSSSRKREGEIVGTGSKGGKEDCVFLFFFTSAAGFAVRGLSFFSGCFFSMGALGCDGLGRGEGVGFLTTGVAGPAWGGVEAREM